jgi:hypothetical protein
LRNKWEKQKCLLPVGARYPAGREA